jgi:hypothetical protein
MSSRDHAHRPHYTKSTEMSIFEYRVEFLNPKTVLLNFGHFSFFFAMFIAFLHFHTTKSSRNLGKDYSCLEERPINVSTQMKNGSIHGGHLLQPVKR